MPLRKRIVPGSSDDDGVAGAAGAHDAAGDTDDPLVVVSPHSSNSNKSSSANTTTMMLTTTTAAAAGAAKRSRLLYDKLLRFVQSYVKYMSSSSNQDKGMKLLQYTLWLVSKLASTSKKQNIENRVAKALLNLSYDVSWARYVTRLVGGIPCTVEACLTDSWCCLPDNDDAAAVDVEEAASLSTTTTATSSTRRSSIIILLKKLWSPRMWGRIMAYSMMGYFPTEHLAYIHWKANSGSSGSKTQRWAERYSAVSCRCWFLYLVAESAQCLVQWKRLVEKRRRHSEQEEQELIERKKNDDDAVDNEKDTNYNEEETSSSAAAAAEITNVQLQLLRNALFLLPSVHWSLPNWDRQPWLPDSVVNGLMWMESVVSMIQSVR